MVFIKIPFLVSKLDNCLNYKQLFCPDFTLILKRKLRLLHVITLHYLLMELQPLWHGHVALRYQQWGFTARPFPWNVTLGLLTPRLSPTALTSQNSLLDLIQKKLGFLSHQNFLCIPDRTHTGRTPLQRGCLRTSKSLFLTSPNAEEKRTGVPYATRSQTDDIGTCENIVYESVTQVITVPHLRTVGAESLMVGAAWREWWAGNSSPPFGPGPLRTYFLRKSCHSLKLGCPKRFAGQH